MSIYPERIDDFAWEKRQVAFPKLMALKPGVCDGGFKGGTLTSGIDCWMKRVD